MAYTEISKALILAGKKFSTTLAQLIASNFSDHETRILALESSTDSIPPGTFGFDYTGSTPAGYLPCDGSAVNRSTYSALFSAIGTTYGAGDGSTTFNLPGAAGRVLMGAGTGPGLTARTLGDSLGTETHTLTEAELGQHSHAVSGGSHNHYLVPLDGGTPSADLPFGTALTATTVNTAALQSSTISMTIASTGTGGSHNNMMASVVTGVFIKT